MPEQEAREHTAHLRRQIQEQGTEIAALKVGPSLWCEARKCHMHHAAPKRLQVPIEQATSALCLWEFRAQSVLMYGEDALTAAVGVQRRRKPCLGGSLC